MLFCAKLALYESKIKDNYYLCDRINYYIINITMNKKSNASSNVRSNHWINKNPIVLTDKSTIDGCRFIENFKFVNSHTVPIYDVSTTAAFNQLIGHAKFNNAPYGNVYYRGVNGLFDNVLPSIMRNNPYGTTTGLDNVLDEVYNEKYMKRSLKLQVERSLPIREVQKRKRYQKYRLEALMQHYAGKTRFVDVVDNHWIALWMGLQNFVSRGESFRHCDCQRREIKLGDKIESLSRKSICNDIYEYVLLIAMPYGKIDNEFGIIETNNLVEVDLRKALPSIYLRPHAQHAYVIRKRIVNNYIPDSNTFYDLASQVVAILRIRIDRASLWLGEGGLLTQQNLFPSPSVDMGYNNLLKKTEIFENRFDIIKYY